jgi:hypothetical protein
MASPCILLGDPPGYVYSVHQWHPDRGHTRPFAAPSALHRLSRYNCAITPQDELAIRHALLLRDRVRHINLLLPPSIFICFFRSYGRTLLNAGIPLSIVRKWRGPKLGPSEDISCPKSTPPQPGRHRYSEKITVSHLHRLPRHARAHEHSSFWLLSPDAISGTSSVPSPTREFFHRFRRPHTPSRRTERNC